MYHPNNTHACTNSAISPQNVCVGSIGFSEYVSDIASAELTKHFGASGNNFDFYSGDCCFESQLG